MKHKHLTNCVSRRWFLCVFLTMISLNLLGRDFTYEGINYTVIDEDKKTCKTAQNKDVTGNLILPSEPNGYTLVSLGAGSFQYNENLVSITIPASVTSLGWSCFEGCSSLSSVVIPESVTSVGHSCFEDCGSLSSVVIPESVTSLDDSCFSGCSSLSSIIIPASVTSLGWSCFEDCSSLSSVVIPESVTSLGKSCFYGCTLQPLKIEGDPKTNSYISNGVLQSGAFYGLKKGSFIICQPENVDGYQRVCPSGVMVFPDNLPYFPATTSYVKGFGIKLYPSEDYDMEVEDFSISVTLSLNKSETETVSGVQDEYLFENLRIGSRYDIVMK